MLPAIAEEIVVFFKYQMALPTLKRAVQQTQAENLNFWMLKTLIFD